MQFNVSLDNIRTQSGDIGLLRYADENTDGIISKINAQNITFRTFYTLIDFIKLNNFEHLLSYKYRLTLTICEQLDFADYDNLCKAKNIELQNIFNWIFYTGFLQTFNDKKFDKVIDFAITILICEFEDFKILPDVCRLIFKRNQNDEYTHDVLWAFLKAKDKRILKFISYYLTSNNMKDRLFAVELLEGFCDEDTPKSTKEWLLWVQDNIDFCYQTNKHYQYSTTPNTLSVSHEHKFLDKKLNSLQKDNILNEKDNAFVTKMNEFDKYKKAEISKFAGDMRASTMRAKWEKLTVDEQLESAMKNIGGEF